MTNYWPIEGSTFDVIGKMEMKLVLNAQLTTDRLGNMNSALLLNKGYASVPPGVYFDPSTGGFTVMVWLKILSNSQISCQRIFDFGNGQNVDSVVWCFDLNTFPSFYTKFKTSSGKSSINPIDLNKWYHFAVSITSNNLVWYINGIKKQEATGNNKYSIFILIDIIHFCYGFEQRLSLWQSSKET